MIRLPLCNRFASLCAGLALVVVMLGGASTARAQAQVQITTGSITTFAGGSGTCPGSTDSLGDGCPAAANANLQTSYDVAVDAAGNIYIADYNQSVVRKVAVNGIISRFAGGGTGCYGQTDAVGDGCPANSAILNGPYGLAVSGGNVFITEGGFVGNITPRVRRVGSNGIISTIAGTGVQGYTGDNGPATAATLEAPTGVAVDSAGMVYIVDSSANVVRRVDSNLKITTIAGGGNGCATQTDSLGDGCPALNAKFNGPFGLAVDSTGQLFLADTLNNRIRKVNTAGIVTTIAGTGTATFSGDNGPATAANLYYPERVVVDAAGNVYIADSFNSRIRKIDATGTIATVAGGGTGCTFTPCSATEAIGMNGSGYPIGLGVDQSGNLFFGSGDMAEKVGPQGAMMFPSTIVTHSSAVQTIVLTNLGTTSDSLQGFPSAINDFAFTGGTCISSNVILPGASCTLQTVFTPTASGQRSATATFFDTAVGSPHTITLYGVGTVQAAQTITFPAIANHIYGDAPFALTATASSGLAVTFSVVSGPATIAGSTLSITGVGPVVVQADQAGNGSYLPAPAVQRTFTVAKAPLTVAANFISRQQGQPNPALTYTMTGFVLGDTQATATTGQPALSTTAVQTSLPGTYPITITAGTLAATNYSFNFVNSSLAVVAPTPTTTTLTVSVPTATTKQVVTLTATTTSVGEGAPGTVTFVDSSTGQVLGTTQLVGFAPLPGFTVGTATLKRSFAAGQHLLQANYNGTSSLAKSSSSQQGLTVTGTQPSVTTLTAQPNGANPANTDLTATVFGFGSPAPTGLVNFNDATASTSLGSVAPAAGATNSFQTHQYASGTATGQVAMGDFNGDGIQDLVMTDHGVIDVLLGNGDGTFAAPVTYPAGTNGQFLAVGDFNSDGALDIAMGDYSSGAIIVLLGNGNGTFQTQKINAIPAPSDPYGIVVADVNQDGIPDLVVAQNTGQSLVTVLLGNGDGTFQAAQNFGTGGSQGVVVGDFNGDGFPDIAATSGPNVAVLLGNGNGTFQPQLSSGAVGQSITAGDFNGDGKLDVALANSASVVVALGKGDGTFNAATSYPVSVTASSIATVDINGDGRLDLVASNAGVYGSGTSVLLGNGNGTFQTPQVYGPGGALQGFAVGDVNGDGTPDIVSVNAHTYIGQFAVMLGGTQDTATLANVAVVGTGPHTISATYSGDSVYAGSVSNNVTVNANLLTQTITFGAIANHAYGNAPFGLTATASSGLPVSFSIASGPASVSGSTLTILSAGVVTVQASQAGNASYAAAMPVQQSFTVAKAVLTLTANNASISPGQAIPTLTYTTAGFVNGDPPYVLTGAPSITTTATPSSPAGSYPIVITTGTLSAANYSFLFVNGLLTVTQATQTIAFAPIANHVYGNSPFGLTATSSSGLPVSFSIVSGPASVAGSTLTILGSGVVTVQASQAGNASYAAAAPVQQTFTVAKAVLTLTAGSASISQGQAIPALTYSTAGFVNSDPPSVLTGTPSVTTTATPASPVGSYPIAIATGTLSAANYSFLFVNGVLTISQPAPLPQTISFSGIPNHVYGNAPFALAATASSNLPVTFSIVSGPATVTGNALTIVGAGVVSVQANQAGNASYAAATPVQQTFTVAKAVLMLTASNASISQGQAIPTLTYTTVGFVNGDPPSVLTGVPSITTTATQSSAVGSYPIVITTGTLSAANYSFQFVNGVLTIASGSVISSISPQEIAAGTNGLKLTVNGSNLSPYTVVLANGAALISNYVGPTQVTATVPPSLLAKPGVIQIQLQMGSYTSPATPLTVVPDVMLTSLTPALAIAQSAATTIAVSGLNFTSTTVLQFNGAALHTTFVSATQLQAVIPAASLATAQTAQITAFDPASGSQSAAVAFSVLPNPAVVFTGPPTANPGTQPALNFQLSQPYPIALSGTMTLTFQPSQGEPDDPAIQFASGGRTFTFALPANTSTTPTVQLQAGTVAGTITVTLTLTANGVSVTPSNLAPVVITVPKSAPVITQQSIVRNGSTITIYMTGYSSSRDMANAYFNFTAVPGATFTQSSFTVPVSSLFSTWFSSTASNQYGSTFTYFQTFTLDSKATDVGSVSVTLENPQGKSQTEVVQ